MIYCTGSLLDRNIYIIDVIIWYNIYMKYYTGLLLDRNMIDAIIYDIYICILCNIYRIYCSG